MGYSNGKITAPVSLTDVQNALGVSSTDLGMLCSSNNINMWARFKPVRLNVIDTIRNQWSFENNKWLDSSVWWKGYGSDMCGITPMPYKTTLEQALSFYDGNMNGWVYNHPTGGANQPYRLQDFAGYNHRVDPPVSAFTINDKIVQDGQFQASAIMNMSQMGDELTDYLTLSDFISDTFDHVYFGVAFTRISGGTLNVYAKCTSSLEGVADVRGDFSTAARLTLNQTYQVYPFICNDAISLSETAEKAGRRYITCPNLTYVNTKIISRSEMIDVDVTGVYRIGSRTTVDVTVRNNDPTSRANCYVYILPFTHEAWNNPNTYLSTAVFNSGSYTLGASETRVFTKTGLDSSKYGRYFVYAMFVSGTYYRKVQILAYEPMPEI